MVKLNVCEDLLQRRAETFECIGKNSAVRNDGPDCHFAFGLGHNFTGSLAEMSGVGDQRNIFNVQPNFWQNTGKNIKAGFENKDGFFCFQAQELQVQAKAQSEKHHQIRVMVFKENIDFPGHMGHGIVRLVNILLVDD